MEITCHICSFTSTNPMLTASCGHAFCWPCLYRMLDLPPSVPGQAKPCPACPTILPEEDEDIISVVPGPRTKPTPDLTDEDDIPDCTAARQFLDLPPPDDGARMGNGLDHMSKEEVDSLDDFQGCVETHPGVISRAWNLFSRRYGSAIDDYIAIHHDLVDHWVSGRGGTTAVAAPNTPQSSSVETSPMDC